MAILTFTNFENSIREEFLSFFPETWQKKEVIVRDVRKNNSLKKGLSILGPGDNGRPVPTVYLEDMYDTYLEETNKTGDPDAALDKVLNGYASSYMTAYRSSKTGTGEKILHVLEGCPVHPQLVPVQGNEEFLTGKVWDPFLDLAVIYRLVMDATNGGVASVVVTEALMKSLGLTREELRQKAMTDRPLGKTKMINLGKMILDVTPDFILETLDRNYVQGLENSNMTIITNDSGLNGASEMLHKELFRQLAEEFDDNLVILPSSVHEVITLPESECPTNHPEEMRDMVKDVNYNSGSVAPENRLSDSVYRYNRETNEFEIM